MHPNASMKYNRRYKDFNEFCEYIKTPEEVMNWYKINKIRWNKLIDDEFYKKPINWPDIVLKEKEGNCFDHAIFMHYFCERYNIENCIVRYVHYSAVRSTGKWKFSHHFICMVKLEAGWFAFEYNSLSNDGHLMFSDRSVMKSSLVGPFETKEAAAKFFTDWYMGRWEQYQKIGIHWTYKEKAKPVTVFLNDKVMRLIDKLYGDRSFTQEEFYNLVKGEMGDTRYEGRDYEYAGFFDELGNDIIVGIDKLRNFREEGDIVPESVNKGGIIMHPRDIDWDKDIIPIDYNKKRKPPEERRPKHSIIPKELYEKYADELEEYRKWAERSEREHKEKIDAYNRSTMLEAKLKADERTDYGLPKKKKYPMPDEAHVLQAIRMFNHCDPEDEAELARNIKKYMKKYNMKDVKVGKNNRFSKYYHTKAINEDRYWKRSELNDKSRKQKFDKIKNFDQFCKEIKSVEEALSYFILEGVDWYHVPKNVNATTTKIHWPDDIIRTKQGICFDHSIFFHYFCRSKRLENRICVMAWESRKTNTINVGHGIPCFKRDGKIYAVIYFRKGVGWMAGPYESWDECKNNICQIHQGMVNYEYARDSTTAYSDYLNDETMNKLDEVYGTDISQFDFLCSNNYKNLEGTFYRKIRIKGFSIVDPFTIYDMYDWVRNKIEEFKNKLKPKSINEEVKMWGYEIRAMVNESLRLLEMSGGGGPMIGMEINDQSVQYSSPGQFIITTKDKDSGVDYGVTNDIKSKYLYRKDKDKGYVKEDMKSYLKDKYYKIYRYTGDIDIWKYMLSDIQYNSYDEDTTIYEDLTGRKQLTDDQIDFDENFRYYNIKQVLLESSILNATTKSKLDELKGKKTHLFDTNIKVSDKFSVAESIEGYCLRYGDYHSDFVSLDELTKIYNV